MPVYQDLRLQNGEPPFIATLRTGKKTAVFRRQRYWESHTPKKKRNSGLVGGAVLGVSLCSWRGSIGGFTVVGGAVLGVHCSWRGSIGGSP